VAAALLVMVAAFVSWRPLIGATIQVRAGDDLQAALDRARPGDTLLLEPGATFTGNFVLPAKEEGSRPIVIRSAAEDRRLPGAGDRVAPDHSPLLPKLASPNSSPVLSTAPGTRGWRMLAIEFVGNGGGDVITLGDGSSAQNDLDEVPGDILLDRVLIRGDLAKGQKRGIALNSANTIIRNSYIADIKLIGQESQAIAGWNGPGPFVIENNFLEAAGVNVIFGGTDPAISGLVPTDITIRRNVISKNVDWRKSRWTVKNLLELKNARRVVIEGNRLENCWSAAQVGFAVVFTVRNSGGRAPWATIEDVVFRNNVVRHSAGAINILRFDNTAESQTASRISIENNLFEDINHRQWGGNGFFLQIGNSPSDVTVDHNTVLHTGNLIAAYGRSGGTVLPIPRFRFTNNLAAHNAYGIHGSGTGVGMAAINAYFPDGVIVSNVLAGGQASRYPAGNFFPSLTQWMSEFLDAGQGDYRLSPRSPYRRAARDGTDLGVSHDRLTRAQAGLDQ
jgi:hypothetical protein